jgi:hypothetical protein
LNGKRIVFFYTTSVNFDDFLKHAYHRVGQNISFMKKRLEMRTLYLTLGVSFNYGVEAYTIHTRPLDSTMMGDFMNK